MKHFFKGICYLPALVLLGLAIPTLLVAFGVFILVKNLL